MYAFCRVADHAVDEPGEDGPSAAVPLLERRLARVFGTGRLDGPVDRAFRAVVREHRIPPAVPEALLEGLRWDEEGRSYPDLAGVCAYAARVGSTVGAMMTLVMGRRDARTLTAAAELGVAMQLTNIARDVGEDARRGRLYLPLDRLRERGLDPEAWLAAPDAGPAVRESVEELLAYADEVYARAWPGIRRLPAGCRPAIRAAALLYAAIGDEIRAAGCDSVSARAWTTRGTKLRLLARAAASSRPPARAFGGLGAAPPGGPDADGSAAPGDPARESVAFLVNAAAS